MTRDSASAALAVIAAVLGIVGIATRPFLFVPIGLALLLVASKLTPERRFTVPAAGILSLAAIAGAAIAVGWSQPLY